MLHDGQHVRVGTGIVEHALDEARREGLAADGRRRGDRLAQLGPRQAWHEVYAGVDGIGEVAELRALTEVVRPHGHDHADRCVIVAGRFDEQPNERCGVGGMEPEQLLELIDDDEQTTVGEVRVASRCVGQAETTRHERRFERRRRRRVGIVVVVDEDAGKGEGAGEVAGRVGARSNGRDPPVRADLPREPTVEGRQEAGRHER